MSEARRPGHGRWVWFLVALFAALHYDFWLWDDRTLWLGWLPAGLGYHALYSIAAGLLWALVIKVAWPAHIEEWANAKQPEADSGPVRESEAPRISVHR